MRELVLAVAASAIVVASLSTPSSATPQVLLNQSFTRTVAPFAVLDEAGRPYAMPFLGGFDVPRPQFVDIDGDADLDLFVQEYADAVWFFENTGTAKAPRYEWRTDRFHGLAIGEWFRFVDLDADGDFDLLSEEPLSHIKWFRNTGTRSAARFEPGGTLTDTDGQPIGHDRQNIPAIVDVDCDGRLDLFIGRVEGLVIRYEAEAPGSSRFAFLTDHFEDIEIIGRGTDGGRPSAWHGANALAFADYDGDRDMDLFWGDFFEPAVLLIENIGATCSTPSFRVEPVALPLEGVRTSGYNAPVPIDLDLDGDLDFAMGVIGGAFNPVSTAADNFYYWERTAPDRFEPRTRRLLNGIDLGTETVPAAGDLDADGDIDLIVGSKIDASGDAGRLTIFLNEGTKAAPVLRQQAALKLVDAFHLAPALGDLDGDGDLDLLVGTWSDGIRYFRNEGTARVAKFVDRESPVPASRMSLVTPALADLDGDGDLDCLAGQSTGAIAFYRNDGTPRAAKFVQVSGPLDDARAGRRSRPAIVDVTGDGLLDLVVGREAGGVVLYRNVGTRTAPRFVEEPGWTIPLPPMSSPVLIDSDGDGVADVVSGTVSGGLVFFKRGQTGVRPRPDPGLTLV